MEKIDVYSIALVWAKATSENTTTNFEPQDGILPGAKFCL